MKRRDNKNRILREGETQRKDGKYEYRYRDWAGKVHSVYSWKLIDTDTGKKNSKLSLRKKEEMIKKDLEKYTNFEFSTLTLNELIKKYFAIKTFAVATRENYLYYYKKDICDSALGNKKVKDIKPYHVQLFYKQKSEQGYADGTIQILHKIIHPALQLAVINEGILRNPSDGCIKGYNNARERNALTQEEYEIFTTKILPDERNSEKYQLVFGVMVGLMLRVGELAGLTWNDVDLEERMVTITHELGYRSINGKTQFFVTSGKTKAATRVIPMTERVYESFQKLYKGKEKHPSTITVDGYTDFVFVSRNGRPLYPANLNKALYRMVNKYNENHPDDPPFPKISNHIFRHTGVTRYSETQMIDLNVMTKIVGHNDLRQLIKVYDTVSIDRIKKQVANASAVVNI